MGVAAVLQIDDRLGLPLFLAIGGFFLVWYVAGNEVMRRRARRLALWCKRSVDPLAGRQSVKWLTMHSFRLEVEETRSPFRSVCVTGLTESWDVAPIWAWNRWRGRQDMVLVEAVLRGQPIWSLELYRPGTLLAGDARHNARREGWPEDALDGFRLAPAGGAPSDLACRLLAGLGDERRHLIRLAIRRQGSRLILALNVPDPDALPPPDAHRLLQRLARTTLEFATPADGQT